VSGVPPGEAHRPPEKRDYRSTRPMIGPYCYRITASTGSSFLWAKENADRWNDRRTENDPGQEIFNCSNNSRFISISPSVFASCCRRRAVASLRAFFPLNLRSLTTGPPRAADTSSPPGARAPKPSTRSGERKLKAHRPRQSWRGFFLASISPSCFASCCRRRWPGVGTRKPPAAPRRPVRTAGAPSPSATP